MTVSARHASLRTVQGRLEVRDLASRHGTFVGSERVLDWTTVPDGESIWLGDFEIVLVGPVARPLVVTIQGASGGLASYTLTGGPDGDELGPLELPSTAFPELASRLPLRFGRTEDKLAWVEDGSGERAELDEGRARVGGATVIVAEDQPEGALISVVEPGLDPEPSGGAPERSAASTPSPTTTLGDAVSERAARRGGCLLVVATIIAVAALGAALCLTYWFFS